MTCRSRSITSFTWRISTHTRTSPGWWDLGATTRFETNGVGVSVYLLQLAQWYPGLPVPSASLQSLYAAEKESFVAFVLLKHSYIGIWWRWISWSLRAPIPWNTVPYLARMCWIDGRWRVWFEEGLRSGFLSPNNTAIVGLGTFLWVGESACWLGSEQWH
jgi:hypothetical protein